MIVQLYNGQIGIYATRTVATNKTGLMTCYTLPVDRIVW